MKRQHILPAGCHDADSAAKLLNVTKLELLKRMRDIGWLYVGGEAHNLPRQELKRRGFMTTQERGYCLKGKREIGKSYSVMLLTQFGFQELKKIMQSTPEGEPDKKLAPIAQVRRPIVIEPIEKPFNELAANEEREKLLQQMSEWNLPIAAGRN